MDYITYNALGKAIVLTNAPEKVKDYLPPNFENYREPRRSEKTARFLRSTRRTLYETGRDFSGVQGEPCTKPGVISQEYKANLVRKNFVLIEM